jgi:hypothetical protein
MAMMTVKVYLDTFRHADVWKVPARKANTQPDMGSYRLASKVLEELNHSANV